MKNLLRVALVPAALGAGALIWFITYRDVHFFRRTLSFEERRNTYVGMDPKEEIKEPIRVIAKNKPNSCIFVDKADLDGSELVVYYKWVCTTKESVFVTLRLRYKAKDGTSIQQEYEHASWGHPLEQNDRLEFVWKHLPTDPRTVSMEISGDN